MLSSIFNETNGVSVRIQLLKGIEITVCRNFTTQTLMHFDTNIIALNVLAFSAIYGNQCYRKTDVIAFSIELAYFSRYIFEQNIN